MATFTITTTQNIDALTGKTGGDIYNINGGTLVIDQDSRYGLNQNTSAVLGNITNSATLGGNLLIDARKVRLIPFNTGTGTVPVSNTVISQGSASGKLIGVYSSLTTAPVASGGAMPASGFIKIKQWNDVAYTAGALTGISASATGADIVGWIEINGREASTLTTARINLVDMLGEWYTLGTTSGVANQTFQIPTNGLTQYVAGVYIEKIAGGVYEFYANAGTSTTIATDKRAKVCWVNATTGVVTIGHNGTANAGFTPVAGLKVVIGNIFFGNSVTATPTANALPNATLATRYDFTTTSAGVINIDKVNMAWYPSLAQAYSISISNTGILEQLSISECATQIQLFNVGVGQTAVQTNFAFVGSLNLAGASFNNCHFTRATLAASGAYTTSFSDSLDHEFYECNFTALQARGNATSGNILLTRCSNFTFENTILINGRAYGTTVTNQRFINTSYVDVISGTTQTTAVQNSYMFAFDNNASGIYVDGVDFYGLTNVQPYLGILSGATYAQNIEIYNIGTINTPLSLGSTNASAYLAVFATASNNIKLKRIYVTGTRTNFWLVDNSVNKVILENVQSDGADAPIFSSLNTQIKGLRSTPSTAAQISVYGTHWYDTFISNTEGRVGVFMNEKTILEPSNSSYEITSGAIFTSAGSIYMPTIGNEIIFEMPYYALGHTSFQNLAPIMTGGTIGNYTLTYQIDLNDGNGYNGTWNTLNGANLSAEILDPSRGFKLKIKIVTAIANTTAITNLYVRTDSSLAEQEYQYPLYTTTLLITGLQEGSDIVVLQAGTETELVNVDTNSGSTYNFVYEIPESVDIGVFKSGYVPFYIRDYLLTSTDSSVPVVQVQDRNYI